MHLCPYFHIIFPLHCIKCKEATTVVHLTALSGAYLIVHLNGFVMHFSKIALVALSYSKFVVNAEHFYQRIFSLDPAMHSADYTLHSVAENIAVLQTFPVYIGYSANFLSVYWLQCCKLYCSIHTAGTSCTLQCRGFGRLVQFGLIFKSSPCSTLLHLPANHF